MMPNNIQRTAPMSASPTRLLGLVLIVDDDEQNRTLLRDPLEARGYRAEEATNGPEALQKSITHAPDVILLDLMMPGMDGFEVCRRLKSDDRTAHIPVLIVTALSERKERLMGIEAGANDFLTKPVDIQDLTLRVANAVHIKHLHDLLQLEQQKAERLLLNILPKPIAERMKLGEMNIADRYPEVTLLVADLVGFTTLSAQIDAEQVVQLLNEVFSAFDLLVERHGLEKIKAMGDAYMVAGGMALPRADHAEAMAALAINLREEIERLNSQYDTSIRLRMGMSTGPVIAGVIGRKTFAYDVWGETVNHAWQLEATAEAGRIQVSESTYERLRDTYQFEPKHSIGVEGQGLGLGFAYWLGQVKPSLGNGP